MRFLTVLMISAVLSGCAHSRPAVVGGVEDMIRIPKGVIINDVSLPTDEGKTYNVITQKDGYWLSLDAWNRIEKGK